jgi:hypothetical protein
VGPSGFQLLSAVFSDTSQHFESFQGVARTAFTPIIPLDQSETCLFVGPWREQLLISLCSWT